MGDWDKLFLSASQNTYLSPITVYPKTPFTLGESILLFSCNLCFILLFIFIYLEFLIEEKPSNI